MSPYPEICENEFNNLSGNWLLLLHSQLQLSKQIKQEAPTEGRLKQPTTKPKQNKKEKKKSKPKNKTKQTKKESKRLTFQFRKPEPSTIFKGTSLSGQCFPPKPDNNAAKVDVILPLFKFYFAHSSVSALKSLGAGRTTENLATLEKESNNRTI